MRVITAAMLGAALLAGCGPKPLTLPEARIDRAATCGVVAAAEARTETNIQQVLPFAAQGRILHYALLAGVEGKDFSRENASAVSRRMAELQEGITAGKWQDLAAACASAFPETQRPAAALPPAGYDTQLGCDALADFVLTALEPQESDYGNELAEYRQMRSKLNVSLTPGMAARAGDDVEKQQAERRRGLAAAAGYGPPLDALRQCVARYG